MSKMVNNENSGLILSFVSRPTSLHEDDIVFLIIYTSILIFIVLIAKLDPIFFRLFSIIYCTQQTLPLFQDIFPEKKYN